MADTPPLTWSTNVVDVPATGLVWRKSASATERAAVQAALGILELARLDASGRIEGLVGGRYRFKGRVVAEVVQACIVSLEPVAQAIDEAFAVEFRPSEQVDAAEIDFEADEDVEPIERGVLDTGRVVYEVLAAALDPYPRAAGVDLEQSTAAPKDSEVNPFAVLAKLKGKA